MTAVLRSRWPMIALVLSLGANMFLAGFILGHNPPPFGPPPGGPPNPAHLVERVASQLPPDDAALLRKAVDANRTELDAQHRRHHELPDRLKAALLAEPFDPQALTRIFAEHDREEQRVRERFQASLIAAAAAMSSEGRRRIADFRPDR